MKLKKLINSSVFTIDIGSKSYKMYPIEITYRYLFGLYKIKKIYKSNMRYKLIDDKLLYFTFITDDYEIADISLSKKLTKFILLNNN